MRSSPRFAGPRRSPLALVLVMVVAMLLSCTWLVGVSSAGTTTDARHGEPTIDGRLFDLSAGALSAAWWRFVMSKPLDANPLTDTTGARCAHGQSGPVFFLVGFFGDGAAERECVVPAGKVLFFPVVNGVDVHAPGDHLYTPWLVWNDLQVTGGFAVTSLFATVDGKSVPLDPANNHFRACAGPVRRCSAPAFSLTLPDPNLFGIPAGKYRPAVADGYYLMLKPLAKGPHTITFGGAGHSFVDFNQDTTYHLTVR
jgi:hypothetical protein